MSHSGILKHGKGPAVITLHSSLSSGRQWHPLSMQLKECFTFYHIDILRYGSAPKLENKETYRFSMEIDRILTLIDNEQIDTPVHLVGHSCGGAIALKFAVEYPHLVKSLILFEPVAFHLLAKGTPLRHQADKFAQEVAIHEGAKAAEIFTDFWNTTGFYQSLPDKLQRLMATDMISVDQDFKALTAEKYTLDNLDEIHCATLLIDGEQSPKLSRDLAQTIAEQIPTAIKATLPVGHMGPVNQSEIVQPFIANFILQAEARE